MSLFVVENTYELVQTVQQITMQCLIVVCKYSDYEEK